MFAVPLAINLALMGLILLWAIIFSISLIGVLGTLVLGLGLGLGLREAIAQRWMTGLALMLGAVGVVMLLRA